MILTAITYDDVGNKVNYISCKKSNSKKIEDQKGPGAISAAKSGLYSVVVII